MGMAASETCIVEIPKGAYTTLFRTVEERATEKPQPEAAPHAHSSLLRFLPWTLAALFFVTTVAAWFFPRPGVAPPPPPWPVAALFNPASHPVQIVVADVNYGMTRLVDEQPVTLERYLSPAYRSGEDLSNAHPTGREARMMKYLSGSLLTSYADLVVVNTLMRLSGSSRDWLVIRSARELRPRDLESGNFVFVGSPSSNPWVSYFQDKLNFQEREGVVGESLKYFQNVHPKAGEQGTYHGSPSPAARAKTTPPSRFYPLPTDAAASSSCKGCNRKEPKLPVFSSPMQATGKDFSTPSASPPLLVRPSTSKL